MNAPVAKLTAKAAARMLGWVAVLVLAFVTQAAAKQGYGTLSGVVLDPSGTPQMGANVLLVSEDLGGRTVLQLLSNQYGAFFTDHVKPGMYAVRVSLSGYLPATEHHVAVVADLTTMLRVQMSSVFASLDTLRRKPTTSAEPDDWKWVLRSSTATRPILQWRGGGTGLGSSVTDPELIAADNTRGIVQVTNGSVRFGSPSSLPDGPATSVSYDQRLGSLGRLLLAGQMSYLRGASGAFASVWLPAGTDATGPETVFVLHRSIFGNDSLQFQQMRLDHTEHFSLSDRLSLSAGSEFVRASLDDTASSSLRPHAQLDALLAPGWLASLVVTSNPPLVQGDSRGLDSAIAELDSMPSVLFRDGKPMMEGGWHEEIEVRRRLSDRARVDVAAFHDSVQNQVLYGSGPAAGSNVAQDPFSSAFLYDGGNANSWGARAAFHQALSSSVEFTAMYSWGGALTARGEINSGLTNVSDTIATRNLHSVAARVSGKLPRSGTQLAASYMWVSGMTLSRLDPFGEAQNAVDPYLHFTVRQPLPGLNGHWAAMADFSNILAQGYVSAGSGDSQIALVPVFRAFRGGVSFQF
jgi:hypothetical protein